MGWIEKLQAQIELYRLEQRYMRRDKRTTFYSDAQYVDGEYVYASSPTSAKSRFSANTTSTSATGPTNKSQKRMSKGPAVRIRELTQRVRP